MAFFGDLVTKVTESTATKGVEAAAGTTEAGASAGRNAASKSGDKIAKQVRFADTGKGTDYVPENKGYKMAALSRKETHWGRKGTSQTTENASTRTAAGESKLAATRNAAGGESELTATGNAAAGKSTLAAYRDNTHWTKGATSLGDGEAKTVRSTVRRRTSAPAKTISRTFKDGAAKQGSIIKGQWNAATGAISRQASAIREQGALNYLRGGAQKGWNGVKSTATSHWNDIKENGIQGYLWHHKGFIAGNAALFGLTAAGESQAKKAGAAQQAAIDGTGG